MVQTTYQKKNGELINKLTYFESMYKIGDTNGFGWKVVDIKYSFDDNYYPLHEYDRLTRKRWEKEQKIIDFKNNIKKYFTFVIRFLGYVILYKILKFILLIIS